MFNNNYFKIFILIFSLNTIAVMAYPGTSRQKVPVNGEERLNKFKELKLEEKKLKKEKRAAIKEHNQFVHLAHQKNRLTSFADQDGFIWFNDEDNKYTYFLSNDYPKEVKVWNMKFSCAESAVQASKFLHKPDLAKRFTHLDGEESWKLAQRHSYEQRSDWYQVRETLMLEVLRAKFKQHPEFAELLVATGDAYLVEHSNRDAFWSDGGDGKGKNRLGYLLMQVRAEKNGVGPVSKNGKYREFVH